MRYPKYVLTKSEITIFSPQRFPLCSASSLSALLYAPPCISSPFLSYAPQVPKRAPLSATSIASQVSKSVILKSPLYNSRASFLFFATFKKKYKKTPHQTLSQKVSFFACFLNPRIYLMMSLYWKLIFAHFHSCYLWITTFYTLSWGFPP